MHTQDTHDHQAAIDALSDAETLRRAEAIGFVREPTLGGPEAYARYEAEDAAEAREWIDHGARWDGCPPSLRPIDARRWLAHGACFPAIEQA